MDKPLGFNLDTATLATIGDLQLAATGAATERAAHLIKADNKRRRALVRGEGDPGRQGHRTTTGELISVPARYSRRIATRGERAVAKLARVNQQ